MATDKDNLNGADITPNDNINSDSVNPETDNSFDDTTNNSDSGNSDSVNGTGKTENNEKYDGRNNLIHLDQRTKEEQKAICSMGGKASGEARRRKRDMKAVARAILEHDMTDEQIDEVLGTAESLLDGDKSVMAVLTARMVQEAGKGSYKHYETLRDTAGFKPKDEIDLNADIMTDADRSLMDKVAKRLNVKNA